MAEKLCEHLLAISKDSLDVVKDHISLKEKHNMGIISTHDKEDRIKDNLLKAFLMIKQGDAFYQFLHMRRLDA